MDNLIEWEDREYELRATLRKKTGRASWERFDTGATAYITLAGKPGKNHMNIQAGEFGEKSGKEISLTLSIDEAVALYAAMGAILRGEASPAASAAVK